MGRFALYKPPLLAWAAGFSARIAGVSRLALRFPVALACSLALGLIFLWAAELRSWQAGVCAAALLASSHLWHVLASLCMTDGLLVAFFIAALYCLYSDPWLESKAGLWGFAAAVAGAILTKSVAGVLPLMVLGLYWLAAPPRYKPAFWRVCLAGALSRGAGVALVHLPVPGPSPLVLHRAHRSRDPGLWRRRAAANQRRFPPVLLPLTPGPARPGPGSGSAGRPPGLRQRAVEALGRSHPAGMLGRRGAALGLRLAVSQRVVSAAAHSHAGDSGDVVTARFPRPRPQWWLLLMAGGVLVWKAMMPATPWGMSFARGTVQPVAPIVSTYCQQERANELIIVGMDDDLYATVLPLPRLRYALEGAPPAEGPYAMGFAQMGIVLTAPQFNHLDQWTAGLPPAPARMGPRFRCAHRNPDHGANPGRIRRHSESPPKQRLPVSRSLPQRRAAAPLAPPVRCCPRSFPAALKRSTKATGPTPVVLLDVVVS